MSIRPPGWPQHDLKELECVFRDFLSSTGSLADPDEVSRYLESVQTFGDSIQHQFTRAAVDAAEWFAVGRTTAEPGGWKVIVGFGNPPADKVPVLRVIGVLVVPADPTDIPVGGLTQRKLTSLLTGVTGDLAAEVDLWQRQQLDDHLGRDPMSPEEERALLRELRRLARKSGQARGFGDDFYALVAREAVDVARSRSDVIEALLGRFARSDPRPTNKRTQPIQYTMVRNWIAEARRRGFLPPTGGRGRRVFGRTEKLAEYERGLMEEAGKR